MALTTLAPNTALIIVAGGAMTDLRPEAHDYSIKNAFPRLGEGGTSQEIIDLLLTRSA